MTQKLSLLSGLIILVLLVVLRIEGDPSLSNDFRGGLEFHSLLLELVISVIRDLNRECLHSSGV